MLYGKLENAMGVLIDTMIHFEQKTYIWCRQKYCVCPQMAARQWTQTKNVILARDIQLHTVTDNETRTLFLFMAQQVLSQWKKMSHTPFMDFFKTNVQSNL